ncbi:MAG: flagellar biosynthesis protein FlhF [Burkholderiaceae bacterium]
MNIQRFTGATAREALAKARHAFGDGTLILSNRQTALGVEVMATTEDSVSTLDVRASVAPAPVPAQRPLPATAPAPATVTAAQRMAVARVLPESHQQVAQDTAQMAMSTLSFQDYVRERMLRRRQTESPVAAEELGLRAPQQNAPAPVRASVPVNTRPAAAPPSPAHARSVGARSIADELQSMRDLIEDRFNTFAWLGQARQNPIHSNLMLKLVRAGFSPTLARAILERMPEALGAPEAMHWMMEAIRRNIHTDDGQAPLYQEGGVYALVGATGVGKTTTAAKLAGLCAEVHGAASVGLITLDTQRVGAHAQLREHARGLGLVAHLAHDRAALQDLLGLFSAKKMVLIDTTGLAPRDPRKNDALDVLDLPGVRRLLVLNAGTHGDTLDEVVAAFKSSEAQATVLSKIDEAVKLGPALDVAIRHQLVLRGVTNGQKVPQDWDAADAGELVRQSMRTDTKSAFDPRAADLGFLFIAPEHGSAGTANANA